MELKNLLIELTGDRDAVERALNPIKSDYQKKLEELGWEFIRNECFYSMLDEVEEIERVWGERMNLIGQNLRDRMREKMDWYKEMYPNETIRFMRADDDEGNKIPSERLVVGVYIQRRFV